MIILLNFIGLCIILALLRRKCLSCDLSYQGLARGLCIFLIKYLLSLDLAKWITIFMRVVSFKLRSNMRQMVWNVLLHHWIRKVAWEIVLGDTKTDVVTIVFSSLVVWRWIVNCRILIGTYCSQIVSIMRRVVTLTLFKLWSVSVVVLVVREYLPELILVSPIQLLVVRCKCAWYGSMM